MLDAVRQARRLRLADDDAIDDPFDAMVGLVVNVGQFVERVNLPVDADAGVSAGSGPGEHGRKCLLPQPHGRRHQHDPRALAEFQQLFDDLVAGLRADRHLALRAIRLPQSRPEHADVIVNLSDRADRRPR